MREKENLIWTGVVFFTSFFVYVKLLMPGIFAGDSGDVVAASYVLGVAHPPGYPLYCLLGHFFSKLPFGPTVAWRYSLFSAFFSSLTLALFFLGLKFLTKRIIPSVVGTFVLAFSYLFWLYAEVQEVFSLLALLVVILIFLGLKVAENFKKKKSDFRLLYLWFFLAGLSLTHHHTILLLIPAFLYLFWSLGKRVLRKNILVKLIFSFLLGFSVYLYVPWSARRNPPINWDNAINLRNLIRLITRADYGTFKAMAWTNIHFWQRLYQFKLYSRLIVDDFTIFGVFLIFLGAVFLFLKKRKLLIFLSLCFFFSGPLFLFYANFPLENYFYLGIFERFLIMPNIFLVIFLAFGVNVFGRVFGWFYNKLLKRDFKLVSLVEGFCFLLCGILFFQNFSKVDFRNNMVGSYFAEDLLNTPESDSIIFLSGDNFLFNSQYLHLVEGYRKDDLVMVSGSRFGESYVLDYVEKNYPKLHFPPKGEDFMDNFFEENSKNFPIYSNKDFDLKSGFWIPVGLLFRYYPNEKDIEVDELVAINGEVWGQYHDYQTSPELIKSGLLLKNIGSFLAKACAQVGRYFFDEKLYDVAQEYFEKGLVYDSEYTRNYMLLGMAQFNLKNCQEAEKNYLRYLEQEGEDADIYFLLSALYKYCLNDEERADDYDEIYEKLKKAGGQKLEEL